MIIILGRGYRIYDCQNYAHALLPPPLASVFMITAESMRVSFARPWRLASCVSFKLADFLRIHKVHVVLRFATWTLYFKTVGQLPATASFRLSILKPYWVNFKTYFKSIGKTRLSRSVYCPAELSYKYEKKIQIKKCTSTLRWRRR